MLQQLSTELRGTVCKEDEAWTLESKLTHLCWQEMPTGYQSGGRQPKRAQSYGPELRLHPEAESISLEQTRDQRMPCRDIFSSQCSF